MKRKRKTEDDVNKDLVGLEEKIERMSNKKYYLLIGVVIAALVIVATVLAVTGVI